MATAKGTWVSHQKRVNKLAKQTGCKLAAAVPAPRVARSAPARSLPPVTTPLGVRVNAALAQAAFSARWDLCPVSAQEIFDSFRKGR